MQRQDDREPESLPVYMLSCVHHIVRFNFTNSLKNATGESGQGKLVAMYLPASVEDPEPHPIAQIVPWGADPRVTEVLLSLVELHRPYPPRSLTQPALW